MNCKPGDLARIIDCPDARIAGCVDRLVRVIELNGIGLDGHPKWNYEEPRIEFFGIWVISISDNILRPIRDPGDDAVDEVVLRVGKPEGVVV